MGNIIIDLFRTDKQALALFIQAAATIMIGLLAWTAANGQNRIAEKSARKELFKLRYENLYQEVNLMFEKCNELVCEYDDIIYSHSKKAKKKNKTTIQDIQSRYFEINEEFNKKMQFNQFLIKPKDFDKLETFCEEYLLEVKKYLWDETDDKICKNYDVATRYSEHRNVIQKILEPYLLHENENFLSFYSYKVFKYLKYHIHLFLLDYFPTFCKILGTILLPIMLLGGFTFGCLEFLKEVLKAPISIKNKKFNMTLKMKSKYLKRNRPWPL